MLPTYPKYCFSVFTSAPCQTHPSASEPLCKAAPRSKRVARILPVENTRRFSLSMHVCVYIFSGSAHFYGLRSASPCFFQCRFHSTFWLSLLPLCTFWPSFLCQTVIGLASSFFPLFFSLQQDVASDLIIRCSICQSFW